VVLEKTGWGRHSRLASRVRPVHFLLLGEAARKTSYPCPLASPLQYVSAQTRPSTHRASYPTGLFYINTGPRPTPSCFRADPSLPYHCGSLQLKASGGRVFRLTSQLQLTCQLQMALLWRRGFSTPYRHMIHLLTMPNELCPHLHKRGASARGSTISMYYDQKSDVSLFSGT